MYSPVVVAARQSTLEKAFTQTFPSGLTRRAPEEIHAFVREMNALPLKKGGLKRPLTRGEQEVIASERLLVGLDFRYAAERYFWIDQSGAGLRPLYPLWQYQNLVIQRIAEKEDANFPRGADGILFNLLKGARQTGGSTLISAIITHRAITQPYVRGLLAADVQEQSEYLFEMMERFLDHLPWYLKPDQLTREKGYERTWSNHSMIRTAWGKSARGGLQAKRGETTGKVKGNIGRGKSFSAVHISECSTWEHFEQLDDALLPAIPMKPTSFCAFESTAKGRNDDWHKHWKASTKGLGRFFNVFVPYYVETAKYSQPPPLDWVPLSTSLEHTRLVEQTSAKWNSGHTVRLTKDQLFWYEVTRAYYEEKDEYAKFIEEYAAIDDDECFQYAGKSIFSGKVIETIRSHARPILDVWAVEPSTDLAAMRLV